MTVRIEGDVDAGVPHLVSNVCRRLAIGDQLTREEMSKDRDIVFPSFQQPPRLAARCVLQNRPVR